MRLIFLSLLWLLYFSFCDYAQRVLPTTENFDYPVGNLQTIGTDWNNFIDTSANVGKDTAQVISGNLEYPGYPMSPTGNRLSISPFEGETMTISTLYFKAIKNPGDKIYVSFLLQVSARGNLAPDDTRIFGFSNALLAPYSHLSVNIRLRPDSTNSERFNIGLTKGANVPVWSPVSYSYGDNVILLVLSYEFVGGANNNDTARLWINPDLSGPEPKATLTAPGTIFNGDDPDSLCYFFVRAKESPMGSIDAIRISTEWSQSPLPVELSQFSAHVIGSSVQLTWRTETEVNNYGFDIQRSNQDNYMEWKEIGFVNGNGNSNSPHSYSFNDNNTLPGKYFYRLKQIDNDGKYDFSKIIEVDFNPAKNFELYQNYPNPFNPSTYISYKLSEAGFIKLKIFNSLGQEVKTLINGYEESGSHTISFESYNLSSGLYIIKLESGIFSSTKKMLLIR